MRVAFPLFIRDNEFVSNKTVHWIATPDKFSSVTVSVRVLFLTTPSVVEVGPFGFQVKERNCSASSEVFTSHVNLTMELIGVVTSGGKGPLMTDCAEQYATNQTISQMSRTIMILVSASFDRLARRLCALLWARSRRA